MALNKICNELPDWLSNTYAEGFRRRTIISSMNLLECSGRKIAHRIHRGQKAPRTNPFLCLSGVSVSGPRVEYPVRVPRRRPGQDNIK